MAVEVVTTADALLREYFRAGEAIRSGQAAADAPSGARGVIRGANHAYAYGWQVLASDRNHDASQMDSETNSAAYQERIKIPIELGADFAKLELIVDYEQGFAQLTVGPDLDTAQTAGTAARAVQATQVTLSTTTGEDVWLRIALKAQAGQTCILYGYEIREYPMVAGDFP